MIYLGTRMSGKSESTLRYWLHKLLNLRNKCVKPKKKWRRKK